MNSNIKSNLEKICLELTDKLESMTFSKPIGMCYLIGHCLTEGLKKAGFKAREVTGTAIFKDKNDKNFIYGKSIVKGRNIGIYHTWCVLEIENEIIVMDPTFKYNKIAIKDYYGIKPHKNIPDIIVTNNQNSWLYRYVEDMSLIHFSKKCLQTVDQYLINHLVDEVEASALIVSDANQILI